MGKDNYLRKPERNQGMSKPTKEEILKVMEENIDAYYELPHYGLIADWFKRLATTSSY